MAFVGKSVVTDGSNPSLNGPIRRALASLGFACSSPPAVTDADLAPVLPAGSTTPTADAWRFERLIDLACLTALRNVLWFTTGEDVDWKAGIDEVKASQFVTQLGKDIAQLEEAVSKPLGPDAPAISVGGMLPDPGRMPNDPFDPCRSRSRPGMWPYP